MSFITNTNKSLPTIFLTTEANDDFVEQLNRSKYSYLTTERKNLQEQVCDLKETLAINKGIICDLLQSKSLTKVE